jgi:branched-chain amino acid transport system substrate-binding protein
MKSSWIVVAGAITLAASLAQAKGVSDNEITLGLITDLSGPIANYGKESSNAATLAVEDINARGGVQGRKLKVLVEDHGYDPKKAILAADKLVTQNGVFAIVGHLGTATNMAVLPMLIDNKVFNLMPQGASKELYDPPSPYKVALAPSYVDMAATSLDYLLGKKGYKRVGILYQDDDFGREALQGVDGLLKLRGMKLAETTSYKRGATDFSSQIAKLKAANCDLVFSATTLREYIGSVSEARKTGFNADFLATAAAYSQQVPVIGGKVMDGVYGSTFIQLPYADDPSPAVRSWVERYKKRFNEDPGLYSMYTYYAITTFAKVADKAGRNLNEETFAAALNASKLPVDELGNPAFNVSKDSRLSNNRIRITQVQNGKWVTLTNFLAPPNPK